jgi:hypothetical protein
MQMPKQLTSDNPEAQKPYVKPQLRRWGTLRELTRGGGGTKPETSHAKTRF